MKIFIALLKYLHLTSQSESTLQAPEKASPIDRTED